MAYGLPYKGQPDWDDELNNSLESLRADVQTALSNSNSAQSNANDARNTAQAVRGSLLNPPDSAMAAIDGNPASAFRVQQDARLSATYARLRAATIVLIGDSIVSQNGGPRLDLTATAYAFQSRGPFVWAQTLLGHRFVILSNAGVGGERTDQVLARFATHVISHSPAWVYIGCGTNDVGQNVGAATIIANWTAMFDAAKAAGIRVIAANITTQATFDAPKLAVLATANKWLDAYSRANPNVIAIDANATYADPATGLPYAGRAIDGVHPTVDGAAYIGKAIADAVDPLIPSTPQRGVAGDAFNYSPNATLTGTSGAASGWASATGPIATGFTFYGSSGTETLVASKVARTEGIPGDWQQLVISGGSGGMNFQTATISLPADVAAGDKLWAEWEFEGGDMTAAAGNGRPLEVSIEWRDASGAMGTGEKPSAMAHASGTDGQGTLWPTSGRLRTQASAVPTGATGFRLLLTVRCASGTLRLGRNRIVKGDLS